MLGRELGPDLSGKKSKTANGLITVLAGMACALSLVACGGTQVPLTIRIEAGKALNLRAEGDRIREVTGEVKAVAEIDGKSLILHVDGDKYRSKIDVDERYVIDLLAANQPGSLLVPDQNLEVRVTKPVQATSEKEIEVVKACQYTGICYKCDLPDGRFLDPIDKELWNRKNQRCQYGPSDSCRGQQTVRVRRTETVIRPQIDLLQGQVRVGEVVVPPQTKVDDQILQTLSECRE